MSKLIIHKNLTPKTLFRITGASIYNRPGWDIVRTKQELVAYLTQFQPSTISIGHIKEMSAIEIANFINQIYKLTKIKYPTILGCEVDDSINSQIKQLFKKE